MVNRRMRSAGLVTRGLVASGLVWVLGGCALLSEAPSPRPSVAAAADTARAVLEEIQSIGTYPVAEDMAPDVRVISEPRRAGSSVRRDTVRWPLRVASWLDQRRSGWYPEIVFELETEQVYLCRGAVLQYGTYPVMYGDGAGRLQFVARWAKASDGALELDLLSLAPMPRSARPSRLAMDCRNAGGLVFDSEYASRRVEVRGSFSLGQLAMATPILDMFEEQGWTDAGGSVPMGVDLTAGYRFGRGWQVAGVLGYRLSAGVTGDEVFSETTLSRSAMVLGGLAVRELPGGFRVGAGPLVSLAWWSWTNKRTVAFGEPLPSVDETVIRPGGMAELGFSKASWTGLFLDVSARYTLFASSVLPDFGTFDPPPVQGGGLWLQFGAGWWW